MKKIFLFITMCFSLPAFTQFHLAVFNKDVSNALTKVIEDYPDHFNNIRGAVIGKDVQTINYASTINIEGADSSIIIQNGDAADNIFSWKEVVFETEDFTAAKTKFHEYFNKIKGTTATIENKNIVFQAAYNAPVDTKRFASILFTSNPEIAALKNVVIDLSMEYIFTGWQLNISVYEHTDYGVDGTE